MLPVLENEITPVSVSMSSTYESTYEYSYVATNAIDKDLVTYAHTSGGDRYGRFEAKLGKKYCVEEVHHYMHPSYQSFITPYNKHTCSRDDDCTCSDDFCIRYPTAWTVFVYSEDGTVPYKAPSDCKFGDTVALSGGLFNHVLINEIVIIGRDIELPRLGNLLHQ